MGRGDGDSSYNTYAISYSDGDSEQSVAEEFIRRIAGAAAAATAAAAPAPTPEPTATVVSEVDGDEDEDYGDSDGFEDETTLREESEDVAEASAISAAYSDDDFAEASNDVAHAPPATAKPVSTQKHVSPAEEESNGYTEDDYGDEFEEAVEEGSGYGDDDFEEEVASPIKTPKKSAGTSVAAEESILSTSGYGDDDFAEESLEESLGLP
jgi:hypothetical protein